MARLARAYPTRRAFITGGASGFGAALARRMVTEGWTVGLLDRDSAALDLLANELGHANVTIFEADVRDEQAVDRALDAFAVPGLELMVNAAGIGAGGSIAELGAEVWREVMDVNVLGVVHGTRAALRHMKPRDRGIIWNIASAAAFHGLPRVGVYNASKAAVVALSEALAAELALEGSRVRVAVKMTTFYRSSIDRWTLGSASDVTRTRRLMERSGLDAEDVVNRSLPLLARGDFYIVLPAFARALWRFKRLSPALYLRVLPGLTRRLLRSLDATPQGDDSRSSVGKNR